MNLRVIFQNPLHEFGHRNLETLCLWVIWALCVLPALWSPDAPMWELPWGDVCVTPFSWSLSLSVRDHRLFDVFVDIWKPGSFIPWGLVGLFAGAFHGRGWFPSQAGTLRLAQRGAVWTPPWRKKKCCDAHQRLCFCFVAIAVTATLCESKLWLWPEMTPVGDGCHKKEEVSVELASARSRTPRAMEEVDF